MLTPSLGKNNLIFVSIYFLKQQQRKEQEDEEKKPGLGDSEAVRGVFAPLGRGTARISQGISEEAE